MKEQVIKHLSKHTQINKQEIEKLLEVPPTEELGDYAFPCFTLSKKLKKSPNEIAQDLLKKIDSKEFEKVEAKGPYINFFLNKTDLAKETLTKILKEKDKYGSSNLGKNKKIVVEYSSPNMAKPFGIGHLRSTIIGNSLANIAEFLGFKPIRMSHPGDWGTPFGKIIAGYKDFGSESKLKKEPIKHLFDIYTKVSKEEEYNSKGREEFNKMEAGDKKTLALWKKFRDLSFKEFDKIYKLLNVKFDVIAGESEYNNKMGKTVKELETINLLELSEGAYIIDLKKFNLGVVLIKKSDGATLYATRDLTAAIDRYEKYKFAQMIYEVGSEQRLYFKQLFKTLEIMGHKWAKHCVHVEHGLYLDKDGKKFATRKGKTIFMEDVLEETKQLAKKELKKRAKLSAKELETRAKSIARAAIFYGDLKNYRGQDAIFDIQKFLSFEGNTGPYLLYTYARAKSIIRKAKKAANQFTLEELNKTEKALISKLSAFPETVERAYKNLAPNQIANYSFELSQKFNEFYHSNKVIGSKDESFRLSLVAAFAQTLKNSLNLLGIETLESMSYV